MSREDLRQLVKLTLREFAKRGRTMHFTSKDLEEVVDQLMEDLQHVGWPGR